jgi:hypothetical protein
MGLDLNPLQDGIRGMPWPNVIAMESILADKNVPFTVSSGRLRMLCQCGKPWLVKARLHQIV